jgi:hypothetical protein
MPSRVLTLRAEKEKAAQLSVPKDAAFPTALTRSNTSSSVSSSTSSSSGTRVGSQYGGEPEAVVVVLDNGSDLPAVPYKLRFALSPQEWDERIYNVSSKRERSGRGVYVLLEALCFFFAVAIPAGLGYPVYLAILQATRNTKSDAQSRAAGITGCLAILIFGLLAAPLFVRRHLIQRRMNKVTQGWQAIDQQRTSDVTANVLWRVILPGVFQSSCRVIIPVPPRVKTWSLEAVLQSDKLASMFGPEYQGGAPLSRVDSSSSRSMFED